MSIDATIPSATRPAESPRQQFLGSLGFDLAARAFAGEIAPEDLSALVEVLMRLRGEDHACLPLRERPEAPPRYGHGRAA